jgi:hypothetical protein
VIEKEGFAGSGVEWGGLIVGTVKVTKDHDEKTFYL